jgi:hypothetical protein
MKTISVDAVIGLAKNISVDVAGLIFACSDIFLDSHSAPGYFS